jgi:cytochrome c oxidase cbb3-type subunit III
MRAAVYSGFAALNRMNMKSIKRIGFHCAIFWELMLLVQSIDGQSTTSSQTVADDSTIAAGRLAFATYCSACHGLDGSGTQRAPSLIVGSRLDRFTPEQTLQLISNGIPATSMPPFRSLGTPKLQSLVAYIEQLRGKDNRASSPVGDADKGRQIFFGSAGCSSCHSVAGKGGFLAPDLTTYGQSHSAEQTEKAITDPAARDSMLSLATVTVTGGHQYHGVIRNEDNFSIQIQSLDGSFHFFSKSGAIHIDREQGSIMPGDYAHRLTTQQLNDLAAYLLSLDNHSHNSAATTEEEEDDK